MSSRSGDLVLCVNVVVSIVSCSCFACLQELLNISRLAGSNAAGQNHPLTDLSALHALQLSNEVQLFSCLAYLQPFWAFPRCHPTLETSAQRGVAVHDVVFCL